MIPAGRTSDPCAMNLVESLREILPSGAVEAAADVRQAHAGDKWFASHLPDVVVFAETTAQVSATLRFASEHRVPVTARGAGYGYVGGVVPARGGIALSLMRMNRIVEIDDADFVAVVEPAVITGELQAAVRVARNDVSAGSGQPEKLHHRREHRHQRGRPALPEIRRDPRLRPRPRGRAGRRARGANRRAHAQEQDRLRFARHVRRFGGHAGRGDPKPPCACSRIRRRARPFRRPCQPSARRPRRCRRSLPPAIFPRRSRSPTNSRSPPRARTSARPCRPATGIC